MDVDEAGTSKAPVSLSRRAVLAGVGAAAFITVAGADLVRAPKASAVSPWGGYSNGQIPLTTPPMTQFVPGQWLRTDAATALLSLMQAYQAQFGTALHINSSYRPLGSQTDPRNQAGSQWAVYNYYGSPRAATPGHSNHGWGLAVDFGGPVYTKSNPNWDWMVANAGQYGWWWAGQFLNVDRSASPDGHEDWHWEFNGSYTNPPTPQIGLDYTLYALENASTTGLYAGLVFVVGTRYMKNLTSLADWNFTRSKLPVISTNSEAELHVMCNAFDVPWASVPTGGSTYYNA